ncbi:MAG: hypothetical protein ACR2QJ_02745 [Geminicoccaceae bacterium]
MRLALVKNGCSARGFYGLNSPKRILYRRHKDAGWIRNTNLAASLIGGNSVISNKISPTDSDLQRLT